MTNKNDNRDMASLRRELLMLRLQRSGAGATATGHQVGITPVERSADLPLSFAQQRLWFLDQLDHAASTAYHLPAALRLTGRLDRDALVRTLDRIVARHEVLRTSFVKGEGAEPVLRIKGPDTGFALREADLRMLEGQAQADTLARLSMGEARAPFDLAAGPLVRGLLLRLGEHEHVLCVTQHHIVSDGWSTGILVREVSALYGAFCQGGDDPLPPLAIQYADYAAWQRNRLQGEALQQQAEFWRTRLGGAPALLSVPADRARPAVQSYAGASVPLHLSGELADGLRALARRHGATLFMTLLAGWSCLLSRLGGQDDIVVGSPVANRQRSEVEPLIGFFVNTLALRVRLDADPSVGELVEQVKAMTLDAYEHQDLPFEQVVEILNPPRSMSYSPVFQAMFSLNNMPGGELSLPDLVLGAVPTAHTSAQVDLSLTMTEHEETISGRLEYATDLFDRATAVRIAGHLQHLLEAMVAGPQQRVSTLSLLGGEERRELLMEFNDTAVGDPRNGLLHELFEAQAASRPDAIAVVFDRHSLSYGELNRRANQLAHYLIGQGVGPDARVAICVERSLEMIVGLLGILKAGGAYVPLDPAYPAERLDYMLRDSAPVVLLTQAALQRPGTDATVPVLSLDSEAGQALLSAQPDTNPDAADIGLDPRCMAYVIYTSGSTGLPKGVMIEHANAVNLVHNHIAACAMSQDDRILQFASFGFDNSVAEIFPGLSVGARLVLRPAHLVTPDSEFVAFLAEHRISIADLPTSFWHLWAQQLRAQRNAPPPSLRFVAAGGEKAELRHLASWFTDGHASHTTWLNTYGPTEATVNAATIAYDARSVLPHSEIPIGRPVGNTRIYVLDQHGQPVPLGVAGEIHIGGRQVARGYLNRPELTAQRFVADPFSDAPEARMYKTGDLGRWLADGTLEYIGRNDFQVKLRGFRIELGEIEAALNACAGVREAIVIAREDSPGDVRLVAYVVAHQGASPTPALLRDTVSTSLADYMVPAAFVLLDALPLNTNGKLDRRALPAPGVAAVVTRGYEECVSPLEQTIAALWCELLGLERVGRHDHFFELGGHSLMVIVMIERLQSLGWSVPVRQVFSEPTPKQLAANAVSVQAGDEFVPPPNLLPIDIEEFRV